MPGVAYDGCLRGSMSLHLQGVDLAACNGPPIYGTTVDPEIWQKSKGGYHVIFNLAKNRHLTSVLCANYCLIR